MKFYAALHRAAAIYLNNRRKLVRRAALAVMLACVAGCAAAPVTFEGPPGAVMFVDGKPYHLPVSIPLSHPSAAGESKRYPVSLVTTVQQRELRASGTLDVFGYAESEQDKELTSTCVLDETNLARLLDNTKVIFTGQTASRQHLYDLTLKP